MLSVFDFCDVRDFGWSVDSVPIFNGLAHVVFIKKDVNVYVCVMLICHIIINKKKP